MPETIAPILTAAEEQAQQNAAYSSVIETSYHLARGCSSIGAFDNPADRNDALLAMLKAEVAANLAAGGDVESSICEYPYAVDVSGHRAEMHMMSVDEDGVISDFEHVQEAEWFQDNGEGIWYAGKRTWDQALWWNEPPANKPADRVDFRGPV